MFSFTITTAQQVLDPIAPDGILVKENGIYRICIEQSFLDKVKAYLGLDYSLKALMGKLVRLHKYTTDCSNVMGQPCLVVTRDEEAESIKNVLEQQGYSVQVKQMAVKIS